MWYVFLWILLFFFLFVAGMISSYNHSVKTKKKLDSLSERHSFSSVDRDSIKETRNIVNFLMDRENGLGIVGSYTLHESNSIFLCDVEAFKKKNHPKILAFIRAAHLAGFTVSVRQKDRALQEREANANGTFLEYTTSIQEDDDGWNMKREEEIERKKRKYGYIDKP